MGILPPVAAPSGKSGPKSALGHLIPYREQEITALAGGGEQQPRNPLRGFPGFQTHFQDCQCTEGRALALRVYWLNLKK